MIPRRERVLSSNEIILHFNDIYTVNCLLKLKYFQLNIVGIIPLPYAN